MNKIFYRSEEKSVCADVIPFFENGEFKLFYLKDYRDFEKYGEGCPWHLLTTSNFVDYKDHGAALLRGSINDQDLYVFTGSVFKKDDTYFIFYTGHNPHLVEKGIPQEKILRAVSKDLIHWQKDNNFVLEAPEEFEKHDFRDPFVFYDEEKKKFGMLLAARLNNNNPRLTKGVTLVAYSDDLNKWEIQKTPFYAPNAYFTHECPDLFKMGDYWYFLFSEFTDKISTTYRMSKSINGPWFAPEINTFDGHAFYAAKSYSDGKRRILFGWNPIKYEEKDFHTWQWGGNIIPHEIVQDKNGYLWVKCPDEIKNAFKEQIDVVQTFSLGNCDGNPSQISTENDGQNVVLFNEMPSICQITFEFETTDNRGDFGCLLRCEENMDRFYKVKFEPRYHRFALDSSPRENDNRFIQVDTERPLDITPNVRHKVMIIAQESVLEVYVDDKVAMSARMFDVSKGMFGLYSLNTKVHFFNVEIKK